MKVVERVFVRQVHHVRRALHLYLSPWKMLSCPMAASKRLRDAMRGGLWSSFSVPAAGMLRYFDPYCEAGQRLFGLIGVVGVAYTFPQ